MYIYIHTHITRMGEAAMLALLFIFSTLAPLGVRAPAGPDSRRAAAAPLNALAGVPKLREKSACVGLAAALWFAGATRPVSR
jgi:hypothetical protein